MATPEYEYRVVDSLGAGPILETLDDAESDARYWTRIGLKDVRIERREVLPWKRATAPARGAKA